VHEIVPSQVQDLSVLLSVENTEIWGKFQWKSDKPSRGIE